MFEVLSRNGKMIVHDEDTCYYNLDFGCVNPDGTYLYKFGRMIEYKKNKNQENECVLIRIDNINYINDILSDPDKWWKYSYNKNKGMICVNIIYDIDEWASQGFNIPSFNLGFEILPPKDDYPTTKINLNKELNSDIVIAKFKSKKEAKAYVKYYPLLNILEDADSEAHAFKSHNNIRNIYYIRLWIDDCKITKENLNEYLKDVIVPKLNGIIRNYYESKDTYLNDGLDI